MTAATGRHRAALVLALTGLCAAAGCSGGASPPASQAPQAQEAPITSSLRSQPGMVTVSPAPGSRTASPATEISFRGTSVRALGAVTVTGSVSGRHSGRLLPHSDRHGASFVPDSAFTPGETVTVTTAADVDGATAGELQFAVARPAEETTPPSPAPPATPTPPAPTTSDFASAPNLHAPQVDVTTRLPGADTADVCLATKGNGLPSATTIVTTDGQLVWYHPMPKGTAVNGLAQQVWHGRPVLTWWQGAQNVSHGYGDGVDVVADTRYRTVATVHAGDGYKADLHDFQLLPSGAALLTVYAPVRWDLRPVGGPADGIVLDGIVQEVDVATGRVLFEWHSLDHIPLGESSVHAPHDSTTAWDYVHVNSVDADSRGDLLISGRHTSALYAVDGRSGNVLWTVGGRGSDVHLGPGATFGFQHDARWASGNDVTLFDDGGGPPRVEPASRALRLHVDLTAGTATVVAQDRHDPPIVSDSQGDAQTLPGGNVFVGWGNKSAASEYDRTGTLVWDLRLPDGVSSYRALRCDWPGLPATPPQARRVDATHVAVSWNGDTQTRRWQVLVAGRVVRTARRTGFETVLSVPRLARSAVATLQVRPLNRSGHPLSAAVAAAPA